MKIVLIVFVLLLISACSSQKPSKSYRFDNSKYKLDPGILDDPFERHRPENYYR